MAAHICQNGFSSSKQGKNTQWSCKWWTEKQNNKTLSTARMKNDINIFVHLESIFWFAVYVPPVVSASLSSLPECWMCISASAQPLHLASFPLSSLVTQTLSCFPKHQCSSPNLVIIHHREDNETEREGDTVAQQLQHNVHMENYIEVYRSMCFKKEKTKQKGGCRLRKVPLWQI